MAGPEYPTHPRPSCHAVVRRGDEILFVQRGSEPFMGWWGFPGGSVELGELVEDAVSREVLEETGIEVQVGPLISYKNAVNYDSAGVVRYHYVILFFAAEPVAGTLKAATDAAAARWVPIEEIPSLPLVPGGDVVLQQIGIRFTTPDETPRP